MMNEDEYEKIFTINKSSKNYFYKLTQAIKFLLSKQRIIEAKYHFNELEALKPNSRDTIELGYEIGTRTFDIERVSKYDELIEKIGKVSKKELCFKRMIFWISMNQFSKVESIFNYIIDNLELNDQDMKRLCQLCHEDINGVDLSKEIEIYIKKIRTRNLISLQNK
ncbi:hypothetical protein [Morganella morganii]|uniref:hypothetical protein n=1 Tax=Morganella morganii TaxID=582 RepID=UPI0034D4E2FD